MTVFLILALLIAILAVIFAVQNVTMVTISFFAWNIHTSLAVALLIALGAGVLITLLVSLPGRIKGGWNSVSQKKKFSTLEADRDLYKSKVAEVTSERDRYLKKLEASENEVTKLEEQLASVSGALEAKEETPSAEVTQPVLPTEDTVAPVATVEPPTDKPAE
jgi:putative membrane protein